MPKSIVCALDRSDCTAAVTTAAHISRELELGLVLAYIASGIATAAEQDVDSLTTVLSKRGAEKIARQIAADHNLKHAKLRADVGQPAQRLAEIAKEDNAAMIVVSAEKTGLFKKRLRSHLGNELTAVAPCPVVFAIP